MLMDRLAIFLGYAEDLVQPCPTDVPDTVLCQKSDFNQMRNGDLRMCPLCSRSSELNNEDAPYI